MPTVITVTLGHGLALKGKFVLLVEVDPQGHIAPALGLEQEPGLFNLLVVGRTLREVIRLARPDPGSVVVEIGPRRAWQFHKND